MAKLRGPQSEFEQFMGECLQSADPIVEHFMARHNALLERVTVLERALEEIASYHEHGRHSAVTPSVLARLAQAALDG